MTPTQVCLNMITINAAQGVFIQNLVVFTTIFTIIFASILQYGPYGRDRLLPLHHYVFHFPCQHYTLHIAKCRAVSCICIIGAICLYWTSPHCQPPHKHHQYIHHIIQTLTLQEAHSTLHPVHCTLSAVHCTRNSVKQSI